ncbi:UNVERIFIED_CONTAM: hypothetical protein FKN15_071218 [Acipenser sinensis]
MSSVAVLTQESFNEHRSGLLPEQLGAKDMPPGSEDEGALPTYREAFPPLPEKAASPDGTQEPANAWTKIRPIFLRKKSRKPFNGRVGMTQVFHVPLEERKYKDMNQFGEGDQAKICVDIMYKTGAHLELSMAKDQGLSIMVSGKLEEVMRARKEIVSRLQTQASATVAIPKEHHRFVIGKNGEKLQELELKTATKIQIPRPDDTSNQIKISGTKEGIEKAKHEILLISAEQDKRAVERVTVEKVYHPFITGPFNKVVSDMMQETGARINVPPPSVNKTEIVITGEKEQVAQAVILIKKIYEEKKKNVTTIAVEVKKSQHKYVIGPKGNSLHEILEKTGVSVEIPSTDSSSETVILRGEPDRLGQALTEVYAKDKRAVERVTVEKVYHPFITGPFNKVVSDMMQETGARINVPPPSVNKTEIVITGEKEQVAQAVILIKKIYEEKKKNVTTIAVEVKKSQHKYVIGPKGNSLHEILEKTGVSVEIPSTDSSSETVILRGEPDRLGQALTEVYAKANSYTVASVSAPSWLHRFIIGKKGQNLAKITQQMPKVHIEFTEGEDKITLEGPTKDMQQVQSQMEAIVVDLVSRMDYTEITVDPKFHRHLIGKGGANINRIKDQYKVSVRIPPDNEKSNLIRIEGDPQGVIEAKQELLELASRMENERTKDMIIEHRLHRTIIGQKGEKIKEVRDKFPEVIINFPDPTQKSDIVQFRGPRTEVEKCTKFMQKMVAEMVENSFSVSVPVFKQFHKNIIGKGGANIKKVSRMDYTEITVDPKFHRHLIGKGGANINRIKDQYKVSVRIPPDNEKSNLIRIEGDPQGVIEAKQELLELASRMENERTKDMIIEHRLHRTIIGQKGEKIKEVRDKFPEVIINFPDPTQKSDIVQFRGPRTEVEKCTKFMQKMVAEMVENSFSVSVPVFKQFHKNIIGKGGANIKKTWQPQIREETNTKIDLPAENSNSEVIVITGKKANCEAARNRVLAIQKELANIIEMEVSISSKLHNSLIGSKGRFVRSIMEECGGVHIHFPTEGSGIDTVTIRGPTEDVDKAKQQLLSLAEEKQTRSHTVELRAKPDYHKFLIGKGGANIRKVRDNTGARIIFPTAEDKDQELITVVGTEESVRDAQKELEGLIKSLENIVEDFMIVDPKHHRHFVSRRGQVLRELAEEYGGVMVSFPRTGTQSDKVTLKGAKDCVEAAKKRMAEIIEDLDAQVTIECVIPQKFHRSIMGPKGSRIQQITRDHNVQIKFPDREDPQATLVPPEPAVQENGEVSGEPKEPADPAAPKKCDVIILSGRKDRCEAAVEALKVCNFIYLYIHLETLTVVGLYKFVNQVNIQVPAPELQSDTISITGLAANLDRAKAGLLERVRELQADQEDRALRSFKLTISVDPKYHPKIIGRKGAVITQIRTEHDVNIQFPDKNDDNQDQITITGYERNAEAARDSILQIVGELEEMVSEDITLDHRIHARIIGGRGKGIRKIMDEFKVDLRFPQSGAADPNCVTVTGRPENVDEAIDHLLNLEEEYMGDVGDDESPTYMKPRGGTAADEPRGPSKGFVVRDAPWTAGPSNQAPDMSSSEEFPSFGSHVAPKSSPWGPKRF